MSRTRTTARDPRTPRTAPRRAPRATGVDAPALGGAPGTGTIALERPEPDAPPVVRQDDAPRGPRRAGTSAPRSATRARAPRHRLLLACTAALAAGLFVVLLLNTVISQGAFRQHELEIELILLSEKEEGLARAVQLAESPREVERRARALGMVPAAAPVFLRLSDGAILGEPVPAPEPTAPVDLAYAPGIQPPRTPSPAAGEPTAEVDPALDPSTGLTEPTAVATPEPTAADLGTDPPSPDGQPNGVEQGVDE